MNVVLVCIGDGRTDCHERARESLDEHLRFPWHQQIFIDDSDHELGFSGAIQAAWEQVPADADYVFHMEMDFTFNAPPPLVRMIAVLTRRPYLTQIALKRQPWNEQEKAAGGIVEMRPDEYHQRVDSGDIWTEHRVGFTTNPCVYPAPLCAHGWPPAPHSEGHFGISLFEDPDAHSAYWGRKFAPPLVSHIGDVRTGNGY